MIALAIPRDVTIRRADLLVVPATPRDFAAAAEISVRLETVRRPAATAGSNFKRAL